MRTILLVITALILVGCGTVSTRSLDYCDTEQKTFIGIPYKSDTECISVSNSAAGTAIAIPPEVIHHED